MKNNFECCYISVGGTFCFHYDYEIGLNDTECNSCEGNNNCENCLHKLMQHEEVCVDCELRKGEEE